MVVENIKKVCIVGAGVMGSGIAQACSHAGFAVALVDLREEFIKKGLENIKKTLEGGIKRGKLTNLEAEKILANIKGTTELKAAVENAELVIEAVYEDLNVKKNLFRDLDKLAGNNTIFVTNTSTISITELAKATSREDKFAGLHFFYPAAINKLVEVIPGAKTSEKTIVRLLEFSKKLDKIPINVKDSPGFAINRFFVPFLNEACKMLDEKLANIPTIEYAAKEAFGIALGPFELMNLTGIPIAYHSTEVLFKELGVFYKPSDSLKKQFEAKLKWSLEGEIETNAVEKIKNRFLTLVFLLVCKLVDEGIATKEAIERGAIIALRWRAGPFSMMNKLGIDKVYELVNSFAKSSGIDIPSCLESQAKLNKPWDLRALELEKEGRIAIVRISRPEALNALNTKVLNELRETFKQLDEDNSIGVVILTGEGRAFVAGADIAEMVDKTPLEARKFTQLGQQVLESIESSEKIVIAAVNGFALGGGCELALACDLVLASEKARFGFPEVGLGIHPGFGGTQRLPRLIGRNKAKELIFTGDIITAKEALEIGLVNKLVPSDTLLQEAKGLANKIASKAPIAIKLAKSAINKGLEISLEHGLAYELETASLAFSTKDKVEGMKAFLEKRKPEFRGE
jgi:enoyl-CoA hydratase/3-hydroxyacyl-CoA dehydrogenase